jgi:hypothetical protein
MRVIFALCTLLLIIPSAHAYLDPGSGSAILQGILGALAAIALTLKLYWHRFLRLIGLRKPSENQSDFPDPSETRSENNKS